MHRPTMRRRHELQARLGTADVTLPPARELAIGWLHDKLSDGQAGLDPYDRTVLIVDTEPNERVWARTVIEVTGLFLSECRSEFRCIVETDVYDRLGLAADDAPLMDAPLASRAVGAPTALMDAVFGAVPPALTLIESERSVH